jgi:hypothetical protein
MESNRPGVTKSVHVGRVVEDLDETVRFLLRCSASTVANPTTASAATIWSVRLASRRGSNSLGHRDRPAR